MLLTTSLLWGCCAIALGAEPATEDPSQLVVEVRLSPEPIRAYSAVYARASITNKGKQRFEVFDLEPSGGTGAMQYQMREVGETWRDVRTFRFGLVCASPLQPFVIPPNETFVARELLFCNEEVALFTWPGEYEFRAVYVVGKDLTRIASAPIRISVTPCTAEVRVAVRKHLQKIHYMLAQESDVWHEDVRSKMPLADYQKMAQAVGDPALQAAVRRAELYFKLTTKADRPPQDRKAAERAAEELLALAKDADITMREMIISNVAHYYNRLGEYAKADQLARDFPRVGRQFGFYRPIKKQK